MKKSEIATIIFVASLSMMLTYVIANKLITKDSKLSAKVKTMDKLPQNPGDVQLSKQFFNDHALNPTVEVYVESSNSTSDMQSDSSKSSTLNNVSSQSEITQ